MAVTYKIKCNDGKGFMSSLLSSFEDKLTEGFRNDKCKERKSCLQYITVKYKLILFKCLKCNKNYKKYFEEDLLKWFSNTSKFFDGDIMNFVWY